MDFPEDLLYSAEHEWVRVAGDVATVGITDYAQDALGDVVFVQLPDLGELVVADAVVSEIESTKSVSEIYSPLGGSVLEVNTALDDRPELVNSDPYGEGWIFKLQLSEPDSTGSLMDSATYRASIS